MKHGFGMALALLVALAGTVGAQDGGKIPWKGKAKGDEVAKLMAEAKKDGKAMMLFFTSEG
jgi:hypothetical protein